MKVAPSLALLAVACGTSRPPRPADPGEVIVSYEVRIPTNPNTPLASVLPGLHIFAFKMCPRRYDIVDRHMHRTLVSTPAYDRVAHQFVPDIHPWGEIIATVRCYAPVREPIYRPVIEQ